MKYRICKTADPENRLEDAAMAKAMKDVFGDDLELVEDGDADFGISRRFEGSRVGVNYWSDPAFLRNANRDFILCDFEQACVAVADIHASGKDAFVKSTDLKVYCEKVPIGSSLQKHMNAMVFSFIDCAPCLMVQEFCQFEYEQRFISVGRNIVTSSPIAAHITPINRPEYGFQFKTPFSRHPDMVPQHDLVDLASEIARECRFDNVVIDCALINGKPGCVEFNPFHIGHFGLYGCDPYSIARAALSQHNKE